MISTRFYRFLKIDCFPCSVWIILYWATSSDTVLSNIFGSAITVSWVASVLKAYNLKAVGLRIRGEDREKVTYKARRVDRVKVCFTLSENPVAETGPKTIYIRIARPDRVIVTRGKDDAFAFEYQGQMINFTMKREIDYQNKAMDICLQWDKKSDEPAMKGIYDVAVFADGQEIGETQFQLE